MKQDLTPSGNWVAVGFSFGLVVGIALGQATGYPLIFMPLSGIIGALFGWYRSKPHGRDASKSQEK